MCFLANVLTNETFENPQFFNVVKKKEDLLPGLPTLIVGWETVKEMYPDASILSWKLDENTYWVHKKRVKRQSNEEGIKNFRKMVFDGLTNAVIYQYFNVLTASKPEKVEFFEFLKSEEPKTVLITDKMVYIYSSEAKKCFGVSLIDIDYEGGNRKRFLKTVFEMPNTKIVNEKDFITYETKLMLQNKRYIIPYLASVSC